MSSPRLWPAQSSEGLGLKRQGPDSGSLCGSCLGSCARPLPVPISEAVTPSQLLGHSSHASQPGLQGSPLALSWPVSPLLLTICPPPCTESYSWPLWLWEVVWMGTLWHLVMWLWFFTLWGDLARLPPLPLSSHDSLYGTFFAEFITVGHFLKLPSFRDKILFNALRLIHSLCLSWAHLPLLPSSKMLELLKFYS